MTRTEYKLIHMCISSCLPKEVYGEKKQLTKYIKHSKIISSVYGDTYLHISTSLVDQLVKNLPAIQETLVQFLSWEDCLEKG